MHKNTGTKIQSVAGTIHGIWVVISIIQGIAIWIIIATLFDSGWIGFFVGLFAAVAGCVIAWLIYLILDGFGLLVANSCEQVGLLKNEKKENMPISTLEQDKGVMQPSNVSEKYAPATDEESIIYRKKIAKFEKRAVEIVTCPYCHKGQVSSNNECFYCNAQFEFGDEQ